VTVARRAHVRHTRPGFLRIYLGRFYLDLYLDGTFELTNRSQRVIVEKPATLQQNTPF